MTDSFALLNFPHSPWLDPDEVQKRFLELSAAAHPDRVHGTAPAILRDANHRFSQLNAAATCLREPRDRLNHLLQLEEPGSSNTSQSIPNELVDLFARVGQTCRATDQFLEERARATSPMLQAQLFAKGLDWTDRIAELQASVAEVRARAEAELKNISAHWPAEKPLARLRELAQVFAMVNRWESQLRERFSALAAV